MNVDIDASGAAGILVKKEK